jgi:hypothetical protein
MNPTFITLPFPEIRFPEIRSFETSLRGVGELGYRRPKQLIWVLVTDDGHMPTPVHLIAVLDLQDRVIDSPRAQISDSLKRRSALREYSYASEFSDCRCGSNTRNNCVN